MNNLKSATSCSLISLIFLHYLKAHGILNLNIISTEQLHIMFVGEQTKIIGKRPGPARPHSVSIGGQTDTASCL